VIAFGKLSGKYKFRLFQGAPVQFKGQHMLEDLRASERDELIKKNGYRTFDRHE